MPNIPVRRIWSHVPRPRPHGPEDQFRNPNVRIARGAGERGHLEDPVRCREDLERCRGDLARCRDDLARCHEDLARWAQCREELVSDRMNLDRYNEELRRRDEYLGCRERTVKEGEEALSRKRKRVEQDSFLANNVLAGLCKYKGEITNNEKEHLEKFDIVQLRNERFIIDAKLGEGNAGCVYSAMFIPGTKKVAVQGRLVHINVDSEMGFHPHEEVAIKYFKKDAGMQKEIEINKHLTGVDGIPKSWWLKDSGALLMENAGCNLYDKFLAKGAKLPANVHELGIQLLEVLKGIHDGNILHMDLKPANITLKGNKLYIVDFGESLKLQGNSITFTRKKYTSIYGSLNMNMNTANAERKICKMDDLWSAYYILYELAHGQLEWRNVRDRAPPKDKIRAMVDSKNTFKPKCCIFQILKAGNTSYKTKFELFIRSLEAGKGLL